MFTIQALRLSFNSVGFMSFLPSWICLWKMKRSNYLSLTVILKQKENFSFRESAGVCLGRAPYIDPKLFIGRNADLNQMDEILRPGSKSREHRRLVLGGKGGIGKTQLAIAYANHHRDDYESVFWINA